jgi:hypothetical protein
MSFIRLNPVVDVIEAGLIGRSWFGGTSLRSRTSLTIVVRFALKEMAVPISPHHKGQLCSQSALDRERPGF